MSLLSILEDSWARSFTLYRDFVNVMDETTLASRLPHLPSNTVGLQLWCVVGARESYARALKAGQWTGFACSLTDVHGKGPVAEALDRSAEILTEALSAAAQFTDVQNRLMVDLLEHEAAHQGQLIRYLYALRMPIPPSWKERFALA